MIKLIDLLSEGKPCWKGYKQVGMKEKDGRQVPNCVPINEDIDPLEAITIVGSVQTIVDGKRDVGYIVLKHSSKDEIEQIKTLVSDNNLKIQPVRGEQKPIIIYKTGNESAAKELKDIAEKYNGYLSYKATEEESRRIGEILGYSKKSIDKYIEKIKASGLVKKIVTDTEIICDNCGWTWDIKDGGDDLYICHNILPSGNMCRYDNNPNLNEGKQVGPLYHYTSADGLKGILQSNKINTSEENYLGNELYYISFTRNKNFYKKGSNFGVKTDYRITLDGDKLSDKYKITPFAYRPGWNYEDNWEYNWLEDEPESVVRDFFNNTGDYDEQEERISFKGPEGGIDNIKNYILAVDKIEDLGEGKKLKALDTTEEIDEYDVETLEEIKSFSKFIKEYTQTLNEAECDCVFEAEYRGRKVTLGKPMQGDVKKFKVYVKNPKGKVVKVNFGQKGMNIKRNNPVRRKAYRARHNCANPGPRHKANYWSCRKW
jgi:hypothetical protein